MKFLGRETPVPREAHVHAADTVSWTSASPEDAWLILVEEHS